MFIQAREPFFVDVQITLLGKRWRLRFVPNLGNWGDCDPPDKPGKEIRVSTEAKGEQELETLLHEMDHAADWHKDEEFVRRRAKDTAHVLYRLGYRREGN